MIKKAVIPCGGRGTRFLPITKAVPKEILPVLDTPVVHYIVEEALDSGIEQILFIISPGKEAIQRYFQPDDQLCEALCRAGRSDECEKLRKFENRAEFRFVYQDSPRGSADAVGLAREFAAGDSFALCWGDDLIAGDPPAVKQLIDAYEAAGKTIIGVQKVVGADIAKYGVIKPGRHEKGLIKVEGIVEKPSFAEAPSSLAALGRYIVTPEFFETISYLRPGPGGELQFTDALQQLISDGVYACEFSGRRYDMGSRFGALRATVELALLREDIGEEFKNYLKNLELS